MAGYFRARYGSDAVSQLASPAALIEGATDFHDDAVLVIDGRPLEIWLPAISAVRLRQASVRLVVLTAASGDYVIARAAEAGALGLVHEGDTPEELISAVESAVRGGCYTSPGVISRRAELGIMKLLTQRELEVFRLACRGVADEETGRLLHLSPSTVESHRTTVLKKLGVADWAELIIAGLKLGVVSLDDVRIASRRRRSASRGRRRH
jgi:DNA-binding NarL/FixJ family response regulator